jgi:cell wall-associated NlpC family hydrolase
LYLRFKPQSLRMKNFFLVSVAIGIFSGTTLTAKAQPSVNIEQINASVTTKKSPKFIEEIEFKTSPAATAAKPVEIKSKQAATKNDEAAAIESFSSLQFKYAQLLNVEVESVTNLILFAEIEKWIGTRYRYGGATSKGIDCSAYTGTLVHNVFGIVVPRTAHAQYANCIKLDKEEMQQGDLVFFNTRGGISHVGMYLGNGYFTHASTSSGVMISNLNETYWSRKFVSGGRITVTEPVVE